MIEMIRAHRQQKKDFVASLSQQKQALLTTKHVAKSSQTQTNSSEGKKSWVDSEEDLKILETVAIRTPDDGAIVELVDIGMNLHCKQGYEQLLMHLKRAAVVGVTRIILTGSTVESSGIARRLCEKYYLETGDYHKVGVKLYFTAGIHPHEAKEGVKQVESDAGTKADVELDPEVFQTLYDLADSAFCVSYGESSYHSC